MTEIDEANQVRARPGTGKLLTTSALGRGRFMVVCPGQSHRARAEDMIQYGHLEILDNFIF